MPTSADIGAGFSNYTGNANLGGGTLGVLNIDTKPLMQLAQYTFLYNRAEYDQRQLDAEKKAQEIATMTSYNIATGIEKDSKILRDKYDALLKFARENPDAINYRDEKKYLEFKRMQNDLVNDINGAKVRELTYQARLNEIQKNTNKQLSEVDLKELMDEVNSTNIRTPLKISPQYDVALPEFKAPPPIVFDVYKEGNNKDIDRTFTIFNIPQAREEALVDELDLVKSLDPSTSEGERRAIVRGQNFYTSGADHLNAALKDASYRDANGNLDETKLTGITKNMVELIKSTNTYLENFKAEIGAGVYRDRFNQPITFGQGALAGWKESDLSPINYKDGISPSELAFIAKFASWAGNSHKTQAIETDDQIQRQNIGLGYARITEDARQFDEANRPPESPNTNTTGNAFDEIGGTNDVIIAGKRGKVVGKISNGYVLDDNGNKFTGDQTIEAGDLPSALIDALKASSGVRIEPTEKVVVTSRNGDIISIKPKRGNVITRQNMENAQKKYDTEQKGQQRTQWGRVKSIAPNSNNDMDLTEAEYFKKYKKPKPKK